jgi:acyl-coenzyme A thioesterase PaaI-like protein
MFRVTRFPLASKTSAEIRGSALLAVGKYLTTTSDDFNKRFGQNLIRMVEFKPDNIRAAAIPADADPTTGALIFPFLAKPEGCLPNRGCHSGLLASLADVFTTVHLWGLDLERRHVSVNLEVNILHETLPGACLECHTSVLRNGKRLAFTSFSFVECGSGLLIANGIHNKAYI